MGAFLQGLQQLGWIDGSSVRIDTRWPAGDAADTRKYAAELVALWPDRSRATKRRSLHVGFSRKRPSAAVSHRAALGESRDTTADPESSKSGNGDLQHLREMTLSSAFKLEARLFEFPPLREEDLALIGSFIQVYNYIELNLRRSIEVFAMAEMLPPKKRKQHLNLKTWELVPTLKEVVAQMDETVEDLPESLEQLDEIELRRAHRNLLGHWASRRFPNHDAIVFLTKDNRDAKRNGGDLAPGAVATAIMNMADLRGLAVHIQPLEAWIARKVEEWYARYHGD